MFAEVIINSNAKALNRVFDYEVPNDLEKKIHIGSRVFVPFGRSGKLEDGFVIGIKDTSDFECKQVSKIEEKQSLTEFNINLAKLMSRKYFCNISDCIKLMLPPGTGNKLHTKRAKEKTGNFVFLLKDREEILEDIENGIIKSDKHIRVLNFLIDNDGIYLPDLEAICEITSSVIKTLEKKAYLEIAEKQVVRNPFVNKKIERDIKKNLTEEQKKAFNGIKFFIDNNEYSTNLIYGITGSGKTEIYMQLIEEVLNKNKKALVLVPEISLTPQMVNRFLSRFGETIAVLHSRLSIGERFDEWNKIKNGKANIVIGARSAIFAPIDNLGIIIIDEEHDQSYKSDSTPVYNAKDLAIFLAKQNEIPLVLGSATPDITTFYQAKNRDINLFTLTKRANEMNLPEVKIVDLREDLKYGNKSMFSFKLKEEMDNNIKKGKQTILFLNRRGYSTFVMCRNCGFILKCKNCNIPLTYHSASRNLKCHYCGFEEKPVSICPSCGSDKIKYFGTGTQKVEEEIKKIYPDSSTIRMDIDTVSTKNSHEEILDKFKNENINFLIGTQMVVKGHHFPNVTLVGVIAADSSLNTEDYRAHEKGFQTLVQVAGRSGREEPGKVIIQTYNPDNYVLKDVKKQDYDKFYDEEIKLRKMLNYPPFCDIILVKFSGENLSEIRKISNLVYERLDKNKFEDMFVYNPVPSPIDKIKNKYRWRIIIKCKLKNNVIDLINYAINMDNIKNKNTSIVVDINPNGMM